MTAQILSRFLIITALLTSTIAYSDSHIEQVTLYQDGQTLLINVNTAITIPSAVEEAIHSGIPLTFQYQFEIKSQHWYKPQPLAKINKTYHLTYKRMTGKYHINNPVTLEYQDFSTLYEAKQFMQTLQAFPLTLINQLPDEAVQLGVRFYLTNDNLPSYIRVERVFNDDWAINSDWSYWPLP